MKKVLLTALLGLTTLAVAEPPPQTVDVKGLTKVVDDVVIPVPSEIFNVLDKITAPNWKEVLRSTKTVQTPGDRDQIALLLGTVIAEGFIAVEATNTEEVKSTGKIVMQLSDALNVGKSVKRRASAIIDEADKKNWKNVRQELDKAQHDVSTAMREMNDDNYAQLVSLGGWLRGTEALTTVILAPGQYSKDAADLLHQPALVDYFIRRLANMPPKILDKVLVKKLQKALTEIRPLIGGAEGATISEKTVGDIRAIVEGANKAIHAKSN